MLKAQLEKAGITVSVKEIDPTTLFSDMNNIYGAQIFATYLINRPYIASAVMYTGGSSPYNFSQWKDDEYDSLLAQATSAVDEADRAEPSPLSESDEGHVTERQPYGRAPRTADTLPYSPLRDLADLHVSARVPRP